MMMFYRCDRLTMLSFQSKKKSPALAGDIVSVRYVLFFQQFYIHSFFAVHCYFQRVSAGL